MSRRSSRTHKPVEQFSDAVFAGSYDNARMKREERKKEEKERREKQIAAMKDLRAKQKCAAKAAMEKKQNASKRKRTMHPDVSAPKKKPIVVVRQNKIRKKASKSLETRQSAEYSPSMTKKKKTKMVHYSDHSAGLDEENAVMSSEKDEDTDIVDCTSHPEPALSKKVARTFQK